MSAGAAALRPRTGVPRWRAWCLGGAVVVALVALLPPLSTAARRDEFAAALQFSLFAIALPARSRSARPGACFGLAGWHRRGVRRRGSWTASPTAGADIVSCPGRWPLIGCDLGAAIAWHAPGGGRGGGPPRLARGRWRRPPFSSSGWVSGSSLWRRHPSPPVRGTSGGPSWPPSPCGRSGSSPTWSGLSDHGFYRNFHHLAGGLSDAADQQIASAVLWFVAAAAFVPVIFWNALQVAPDRGRPRRRTPGAGPGRSPPWPAADGLAGSGGPAAT